MKATRPCPPRPTRLEAGKGGVFLLWGICPFNSSQFFPNTDMDLAKNLGLFTSDQALLTNATLKKYVDGFIKSANKWRSKFSKAMVKMGNIGSVPRGCVPVLVCDGEGGEGERFVVRVEALRHPSFAALLEMAAHESLELTI